MPIYALLSRVAAVVHNGDIADCAAALAAGVPQVIIGVDRQARALGKRMRELGVARHIPAVLARPKVVASLLDDLLKSRQVARKCTELAETIRQHDPANEIRPIIESAARRVVPAEQADSAPVISMSSLGRFGRFGNQILQYGFLRLVAQNHGYRVQVPAWQGEVLFGHRDPRPLRYLPPAAEKRDDAATLFEAEPLLLRHFEARAGAKAIRLGPEALTNCPPNVDLCGNFMFHTSVLAPYRDDFRALFEPADEIRQPLEEGLARLRERGKTLIGIQARRGDFVESPLSTFTFVVPPAWWRQWIRSVWEKSEDPVLYIASDDPESIASSLSEFKPVTARQLGVKLPPSTRGCGFIVDHYILSHCDRVAISNSSFGFTASLLNREGREFFRATPDPKQPFVPFDPWSAEPLLHCASLPTRKTLRDIASMTYRTQGLAATAICLAYHLPKAWVRQWSFRALLAILPNKVHAAPPT